jgi:hypothetical protein
MTEKFKYEEDDVWEQMLRRRRKQREIKKMMGKWRSEELYNRSVLQISSEWSYKL